MSSLVVFLEFSIKFKIINLIEIKLCKLKNVDFIFLELNFFTPMSSEANEQKYSIRQNEKIILIFLPIFNRRSAKTVTM